MNDGRSFLWQDLSVVLDANGGSNADTFITPPESTLRTHGAQGLRLTWEVTLVPLGGASGDIEYESSDSPEPCNALGVSAWSQMSVHSVTTRGLTADGRGYAVDTTGTAGGLAEYVRVKLQNPDVSGPVSVRLRVWATLVQG